MATRAGPGHASCSFCRRLRSEGDLCARYSDDRRPPAEDAPFRLFGPSARRLIGRLYTVQGHQKTLGNNRTDAGLRAFTNPSQRTWIEALTVRCRLRGGNTDRSEGTGPRSPSYCAGTKLPLTQPRISASCSMGLKAEKAARPEETRSALTCIEKFAFELPSRPSRYCLDRAHAAAIQCPDIRLASKERSRALLEPRELAGKVFPRLVAGSVPVDHQSRTVPFPFLLKGNGTVLRSRAEPLTEHRLS